jgi:hypothetical protein
VSCTRGLTKSPYHKFFAGSATATDDFLGSILELGMNLPKKELMGILCDYITSIDGDVALE